MSHNSFHFLQPGDTVDIIAPAAKCHPVVVDKIRNKLSGWGLNCCAPNNLFGEDLLCANSDESRFKQLELALTNEKSKAIWCLLGGYGSARLIPFLAQLKKITQKKFFIGFSDITALHIFLQQQWGWQTLHAPSARLAAIDKVSIDSIHLLQKILFGQQSSITYSNLLALNNSAKQSALISGAIIGGNLHLIQSSLGTPWQIDPTSKILFIEEINERAYRIDRILNQLQQAHIVTKAKAILFGDFLGGEETDGTSLVKETLLRFAENCSIPTFQIADIGHGFINNPLVLGKEVKLVGDQDWRLQFNTA